MEGIRSKSLKITGTYREIWHISYPIILGSLAQSIIAFSDTAFMGRVSEVGLAAIGYVSLFYLILFTIGYGYTKGTQILIARRIGEDNKLAVGKIVDNSLIAIFLMATAIFIFFRYFSGRFLNLIIIDHEVAYQSALYLRMRSFGIFFSFFGTVIMAFYMGIGRTKVLVWGITIMSSVNIALNYCLIFGKAGFPEMGISGAALASNIAEMVVTAYFIIHILLNKYHRYFGFFKLKSFDRETIKSLTNLSMPIVGQFLIGLGGWFTFFTLIEKMGSHELAISNVAKNIYTLLGLPTWGFASAANTIVSNVIGQNRHNEVSKVIKRFIVFSFIFSFITSLSILIFPKAIAHIYTDNITVITDTVPVLYVCAVAMWIFSVSAILFNSIVSTGSTRVTLLIEVITIAFYLTYVFLIIKVFHVSLAIAWTSEWTYWIILAIFTSIYLKTDRWKEIEL